MDEDESRHAGKPRPWPLCVRWGHSSPPPKKPHNFRRVSVVAEWLHARIKMPPGMEVGLGPGDCVGWGPSSPCRKRAELQFSAHVYCGQTAGYIKVPLGTEVRLGPGDIVLDGDPAPPPKRCTSLSIVAKRLYVSE